MINSFLLSKDGQLRTQLSDDEIKKACRAKDSVLWVDFEAASDEESQALTKVFEFHPLTVEDCINTSEHPKLDNYEEYLFLVLHAVNFTHSVNKAFKVIN
jgi:magnesium transporter